MTHVIPDRTSGHQGQPTDGGRSYSIDEFIMPVISSNSTPVYHETVLEYPSQRIGVPRYIIMVMTHAGKQEPSISPPARPVSD